MVNSLRRRNISIFLLSISAVVGAVLFIISPAAAIVAAVTAYLSIRRDQKRHEAERIARLQQRQNTWGY